ncbi:MAG: hypothetical protein WCA19_27645, partial [Candidatus Acidiferrales bacterium]
LSVEEYQELSEHLRACPSCRHATDDFAVILDKMPVGEADVDEKTLAALQGDSYRARFLKRAVAEGVPFSGAVMRSRFSITKWSWPRIRLMPSLAAVAATVIVILSVQLFKLSRKGSQSNGQPIVQDAQGPTLVRDSQDKRLISQLQARVAALESETNQQQTLISDLKARLSQSRAESNVARGELAKTTDQLAEVQREASETQRALDSAKADLNRVLAEKDSVDAALVDQQIKLNELAGHVKEEQAIAERERQLTVIAEDVRELMGARNLHILDVSDVDGNGRTKKSFGRVFLVEGKSLIFYAFDLGDRGNPAKVSFQAWGQLEGRQAVAKSLGVFYVDDHAQKRWVLKVNDPEKLIAINSVFVTVEPLGGADRPTGKKLLYAYLGTQANHP